MDAMEAEHKKDSHRERRDDDDAKKDGDEVENEEGRDKMPGSAKDVIADDADRYEQALADAQPRADAVFLDWGLRAPAPLAGETVRRTSPAGARRRSCSPKTKPGASRPMRARHESGRICVYAEQQRRGQRLDKRL